MPKNWGYYHVDCGHFPSQIKLCFSNETFQRVLKDHGITEKADPGNPVTGNGYERRAKYIPGNWFDAIDAFWRASILKEYFGKEFVDTYCTLKEVEADRFYAEPTARDFEWYLRTV